MPTTEIKTLGQGIEELYSKALPQIAAEKILVAGLTLKASHIYVTPLKSGALLVSMRGINYSRGKLATIPQPAAYSLISRFKMMALVSITERTKLQTGTIHYKNQEFIVTFTPTKVRVTSVKSVRKWASEKVKIEICPVG